VSSSRIEGLRASHRTIAEALEGPGAAKATALAIANNVGAMQDAITMAEAGPLEVSTILDIHRRLVAHTQHEPLGGVTRQAQNWIGPSNHGPYGAIYVPPPPGEVDRLLADLVQFAARGDLPAMAQAAIVHAQFEAIHPFADGNGRVGRVLIHVVFRRRGLSPHVVPPLSTVLAARQSEYFAALAAFQQQGDVARWITHFATATAMAADSAQHLGAQIAELVTDWTVRIGPRRAGAVAPELLPLLVQRPIVSAATAAKSVGVTDTAMRRVLGQLEQSGIVRQITIGRRNRVWAADEVFDLLDRFEHDVASSGDGGLPSPTRHLRND
jgi:Fic family protein